MKIKEAVAFNDKEIKEGDFTSEHTAKLVEFWQENHGLKPDGFCGAMTQKSISGAIGVVEAPAIITKSWESWDGPAAKQPRNYDEAIALLGNPQLSNKELDKNWYKEKIVECHEKLGNQLIGVPRNFWVKIHRTVEPYLREACRRANLTSEYKINRLGGFVYRHIRNNPQLRLSGHASGLAVDANSAENYAIQFKKGAAVPSAWSDEWLKLWPNGMDKKFVEAFQSCGFAWGSDWDEDGLTEDHKWQDPMHFEWIARDGNSILV